MTREEEQILVIEDDSTPAPENKNVIKAINPDVTHRICSGQVIVTLSTAVKELVENSLDAGATNVEIRLVDSGSKLIEVHDNGKGVEPFNFAGLALKHHTSKLFQFEDLESIATFGFRGEALSSLCALSTLTVTTRHRDSPHGSRIDYDVKGRIISQVTVAREVGTTVTLRDIFAPLPVRHKEFLKNLKREYGKMVSVLYGYSFVTEGVRISCKNETQGNKPATVFCVPANESPKQRISTIFGSKQLASLIDIDESEPISDEILAEYGLNSSSFQEARFKLTGVISGPNSGRSSADRQFYFINSRPCESVKITRLVNEVYHTFSRSQYPFICLNIFTNQENVDVNVTPDKRVIYLQSEKILYAKIKLHDWMFQGTLLANLTKASYTYFPSRPTIQTTLQFLPSQGENQEVQILEQAPVNSSRSDKNGSPSTSNSYVGFDQQYSGTPQLSSSPLTTIRSYLSKFQYGGGSQRGTKRSSPIIQAAGTAKRQKAKQSKITSFVSTKMKWGDSSFVSTSQTFSLSSTQDTAYDEEEDEIEIIEQDSTPSGESFSPAAPKTEDGNNKDENETSPPLPVSSQTSSSIGYSSSFDLDWESIELENSSLPMPAYDLKPIESFGVGVDWSKVLQNSSKTKEKLNWRSGESVGRKFRAQISPEDNSTAENELKKELSKEMFKEMRIIGQFNLGFLITKLGSDLFIIDQHAADEKFNYEDLEKTTVLQGQRLIIPMMLQLPVTSENIIIDNLEVFEKNGFFFNIKKEGQPTGRVSLIKIPFSKSCQFGRQDVEELIFLLEDAPEKSFYRPMKVKTMLASRACRKSVMIGDKLSIKDMKRVVGQLGEMDQPWNCPHGRPTLRHLFNLDLLPDVDWFRFSH